MKAIGGYFELELKENVIYHEDAIALNTGRNALEYILEINRYKKIYLPYFTCEVLLQPIKKLNLEYEFYSVDAQLEPVFNFEKINEKICFLYTNYFGLKNDYVQELANKCNNLIIDNAQSFYSKPIQNISTFYSCRKFFGVPDGSYLYTNDIIERDLYKDQSYERFEHLLKRIDQNAENGYSSFLENDEKLDNQPLLHMSNLTRKIMQSIDYESIAKKRIENYLYLEKELKTANMLKLDFDGISVPMVYPFWGTQAIREKLLDNKIFTARYWPNVITWCEKDCLETELTNEVIHLPIDQRQTKIELDKIIKIIVEWK